MGIKNLVPGLLLLAFVSGYSQQGHVMSYDESDGLGRADVTSLYYDSRDILWIGTSASGVYQFQQARFIQPVTTNATGFEIRQIGEDGPGNLLILSEQGLSQYDGHATTRLSINESIVGFATSKAGTWYATSDSLVFRQNDGTLRKIAMQAELLIPRNDEVLIATDDQLITLDANLTQLHSISLPKTSGQWNTYAYAIDESFWIANEDGQLVHLDENRSFDFKLRRHITSIAAGAMGSLFIGNANGASIYQPQDSTWITLPVKSAINCLYFDRENRLWMGSSSEGLLRYFGEQHQIWPVDDNVEALRLLGGATTYETFVQTDIGAYQLIEPQIIPSPTSDRSLREMYQDALSRLWALTDSALWMFGDTGWIRMDTSVSVREGRIVGSDNSGNLWIDSGEDLFRYGMNMNTAPAGISFKLIQVEGKIPPDETVAVLSDNDKIAIRVGRRSIGTISGDRYEQAHHFTYDLLSADLDRDGNLWLGTRAVGIFQLNPHRGATPKPLKTTYPIRSYDVVFIRHLEHAVIAGTDRNIIRFFTDTSGVNVTKVDALNEQAGIQFYERTPAHYAMTNDDRLLFVAGQQIVEFDLSRTDRVDHVPTVFLEKVFVNGTDIYETEYKKFLRAWGEQTQAISLLPTERSVSFTFSGNSVEDEHLYYSWRLRGLDEKWSAPTALNEVQFNDLKPGNYVFDLKVCDDAGNCGRLKVPWKFAIAKPLYAKSWFWVLVFGIVLLSGLFLYKQRERRQRKAELLEKKRLEAELNALTLEQKSLQLQMNPHFIFNTLQALRSHIHEEKLEQARTNLNRFAKLIRSMLDVNRSELITLEEELEFLQAYADVQSITLHKPLDFAIEVEEIVEPHAIKIPPMLLQPVVENAIKYGGNGDTVKVDVHVAVHNEVLHVTIRDNGTGFGSHASAHKSAALDILKNRLMRMGQGGGIDIGGGKEGAVVVVRIPV